MTRRADRLFQIVQILRGRRLTTAALLAERLGVSERTVYRDIRDLSLSGVPVEGDEKLAAVRRYGDEQFGPGNWELAYAYGDHHSDRAILAAAEHPRAVSPDRPLSRTAREKGGEILDW